MQIRIKELKNLTFDTSDFIEHGLSEIVSECKKYVTLEILTDDTDERICDFRSDAKILESAKFINSSDFDSNHSNWFISGNVATYYPKVLNWVTLCQLKDNNEFNGATVRVNCDTTSKQTTIRFDVDENSSTNLGILIYDFLSEYSDCFTWYNKTA